MMLGTNVSEAVRMAAFRVKQANRHPCAGADDDLPWGHDG